MSKVQLNTSFVLPPSPFKQNTDQSQHTPSNSLDTPPPPVSAVPKNNYLFNTHPDETLMDSQQFPQTPMMPQHNPSESEQVIDQQSVPPSSQPQQGAFLDEKPINQQANPAYPIPAAQAPLQPQQNNHLTNTLQGNQCSDEMPMNAHQIPQVPPMPQQPGASLDEKPINQQANPAYPIPEAPLQLKPLQIPQASQLAPLPTLEVKKFEIKDYLSKFLQPVKKVNFVDTERSQIVRFDESAAKSMLIPSVPEPPQQANNIPRGYSSIFSFEKKKWVTINSVTEAEEDPAKLSEPLFSSILRGGKIPNLTNMPKPLQPQPNKTQQAPQQQQQPNYQQPFSLPNGWVEGPERGTNRPLYTSAYQRMNSYKVPAYKVIAEKFPIPAGWILVEGKARGERPFYAHVKSKFTMYENPGYLLLDEIEKPDFPKFLLNGWKENIGSNSEPFYTKGDRRIQDFPIPSGMQQPFELPPGWTRVLDGGKVRYVFKTGFVTETMPKFMTVEID